MSSILPDDRALWAAVVTAELHVHRARAAFLDGAKTPHLTLRSALINGGWDEAAALEFLRIFSRDLDDVLGLVFERALTSRSAEVARETIASGAGGLTMAKVQELSRLTSEGSWCT
jgi:hypothetical protein